MPTVHLQSTMPTLTKYWKPKSANCSTIVLIDIMNMKKKKMNKVFK